MGAGRSGATNRRLLRYSHSAEHDIPCHDCALLFTTPPPIGRTLTSQAQLFESYTDAPEDSAPSDKPRKPGNTRVTGKEQFYTPPDIADRVLSLLTRTSPDWTSTPFLEPAGGTGTFIDAARRHGVTEVHSWDIEPHHPEVARGNFLMQSLRFRGATCATNPPFGRNNALAIPFFNHAAPACDTIAFIVPRSWRKWSVINRLDQDFTLVEDVDLKINYLDAHGRDVHAFDKLRTCIQIWSRQGRRRPKYSVEDRGLIARTSPDEADVALTIFGYSCGTVSTEFERRKVTTQMYLKLKDARALDALQSVDFSRFFLHTAYTEALSIKEINYLINEHVFGDPGLLET